MKCLRCGYCCIHYMVVIVDDPEKGIQEDNVKAIGMNGPERCKHLRGDKPGEFSCEIHDYDWYVETPCYQHTQIGKDDEPCRIGQAVLSGKILL